MRKTKKTILVWLRYNAIVVSLFAVTVSAYGLTGALVVWGISAGLVALVALVVGEL